MSENSEPIFMATMKMPGNIKRFLHPLFWPYFLTDFHSENFDILYKVISRLLQNWCSFQLILFYLKWIVTQLTTRYKINYHVWKFNKKIHKWIDWIKVRCIDIDYKPLSETHISSPYIENEAPILFRDQLWLIALLSAF